MDQRTVLLISAPEWGWTDLRAVLAEMTELTIAGEARTTENALEKAERIQPDVVISAAKVRGVPTRGLLHRLRTEVCPAATLIRFSLDVDPQERIELEDLSIAGHLLWNELDPGGLRASLVALIHGGVVVRSRGYIEHFIHTHSKPSNGLALKPQDIETLQGLAAGFRIQQIAESQGVSARTVERRIDALKDHLGAESLYMLACKAMRHKVHG